MLEMKAWGKCDIGCQNVAMPLLQLVGAGGKRSRDGLVFRLRRVLRYIEDFRVFYWVAWEGLPKVLCEITRN